MLVWAVESGLLGLWALVLAEFSTPFHSFIAYSHSAIALFTLLMQLLAAARSLDIGPAVAEAFVCAVSGLLCVYIMALLDPGNYTLLFSMPVVEGLLPMDACIGLGWFSAALASAMGMALSGRGRKRALMFHHFGYHMLIVPPSFLVFWLYNYDGQASEPVSQAIAFLYQGVRITHWLYTLVLAGLWAAFVVLQATGESLQLEGEWPDFSEMTARGEIRWYLSVALKLAGRLACVLIPISAAFTARTRPQVILSWILTGIGGLNAVDWLHYVDRIFSKTEAEPLPDPSPQFTRIFDPAALSLPRDKNV